MNKQHSQRLGTAAIVAALLATSSLAFAQPRDFDRRDGGPRYDYRHDRRGPPGPPPGPGFRHDGRGAGPNHDWYRGGRIPPQYRSRQYVVNDWRMHHLAPPPRGYQWVQYGGDYVLAAIATGVIAQLILGQ